MARAAVHALATLINVPTTNRNYVGLRPTVFNSSAKQHRAPSPRDNQLDGVRGARHGSAPAAAHAHHYPGGCIERAHSCITSHPWTVG
eukprot:5527383-Pyramimonas_sp.AAC.1